MLENMRCLIIIKERNRNYILRLVFMNIFDPNINHEILFVMNIGELMQTSTFCIPIKILIPLMMISVHCHAIFL